MKRNAHSNFFPTAIALATLVMITNVQAQDSSNLSKVEVTGSLIKRLDTEAALPVTTIKAEEFTARGITCDFGTSVVKDEPFFLHNVMSLSLNNVMINNQTFTAIINSKDQKEKNRA